MIKIKVPLSLTKRGQPFRELAEEATIRYMTGYVSPDGLYMHYEDKNPTPLFYSEFPPEKVALLVSAGGSVTGYKSFIKMTKENAENTDVPDYLPNSTKMIELDSEVSKKWSEMTPFHEYTIEGVDYIFKEADAHGLNEGVFIAECYADADIEVLTVSEFVALRETLFPESTPE